MIKTFKRKQNLHSCNKDKNLCREHLIHLGIVKDWSTFCKRCKEELWAKHREMHDKYNVKKGELK